MSKVVDPYYEWLGIPPKDQPPNHYRLLGLELFEENRNVIDAAANRQMGFIKDYQAGPYSDLTQQVLNELSAARICLLSPKSKAEYDRNLKRELDSLEGAAAPATEVLSDSATVETHAPPTLPPLTLPSAPTSEGMQPRTMVIAAGIAIGCILTGVVVGFTLLQLLRRDDARTEPLAQQTVSPDPALADEAEDESSYAPEVDSGAEDGESTDAPEETEPGATLAELASAADAANSEPGSPASAAIDEPSTTQLADASTDVGVSMGESMPTPDSDSTEPAISTAPDISADNNLESADSGGTQTEMTTPPVARLPVPSLDRQQRFTKEVSSLYEIDTQSDSRKGQLCEELLQLGRDPLEKPERRFVLLRLVAQMASEIGDCETMFAAVDEIASLYDIQGSNAKAKLLLQMLGTADDAALVIVFLRNYDRVLAELLGDDDYETAGQLSGAARALCDRPIGSKEFRQAIIDRHGTIETVIQDHAIAQKAIAAAQQDRGDAAANLTAGRWLCFVKDDWSRGLAYLTDGSDAGLRSVANAELQDPPQDTAGIFRLADQWWQLAQAADELDRRSMLLRARHWYAQVDKDAIPGMDRVKIERRVTEIDDITGQGQQNDSDAMAASEAEGSTQGLGEAGSDLAALFSRGLTAALGEHDFKQAERYFDRCVDKDPGHIPSLNNRALTNLRCDNTRGAIHSFELAVGLSPDTTQVAHNMALLARLIDKKRANLDSSSRQKLDSALAATGMDATYRLARGFIYMPFDGGTGVSSDLVDLTCLACNGLGRVDCPVRGCTRGTVGSTRSDVVGRNTTTGQAIVKVRPIRVPCKKCNGRGAVDCPYCSSGVMTSLD
jgi:tetratricopeptide (TPR) repeat protein